MQVAGYLDNKTHKLKLEVTFDDPEEQEVFTELFNLMIQGVSQRLDAEATNFYGEPVLNWKDSQYDPRDFQ